jgi:dTDP-4-dehydrorhamnose reductase
MSKKVLVLGGTGMLGHALFYFCSDRGDLDVYTTVIEREGVEKWFPARHLWRVRMGVCVENFEAIIRAVADIKPDVVINCIGIVKVSQIQKDPLSAISINAGLPHKLASICLNSGARLIHISSDGVFDGRKGMYTEQDAVNISDFYGMTKFLGEVSGPNCLTIRTSIIGHELVEKKGFVEWFLSQTGTVRGYTKAIYSGFPTTEFARIITDYIIPNDNLSGIQHISSEPISKFNLLKLIAERYGKQVEIEPCEEPVSDRSLNSSLFRSLTGYAPAPWVELVDRMYCEHEKHVMETFRRL